MDDEALAALANSLMSQWLATNVEALAQEIVDGAMEAEAVKVAVDLLPSSVRLSIAVELRAQIGDGLELTGLEFAWLGGDLYEVTATFVSTFEVDPPLLSPKEFDVTTPVTLTVDAEEREVTEWSVDVEGIQVRQAEE